MKADLVERATTWGTIPLGNSRVQVRHLVLLVGAALWLLPTLLMTGVPAIAWIAFNISFLLVLIVAASAVRAVPLHKLAICFFAGGLFMGLDLAFAVPIVKVLGDSPFKPLLTVPLEELAKCLPVLILLWRGRKFSSWTLGATDLLLMGAACGAGFAIVEDAFTHAAQKSLNNLSVFIPAAELVNGRVISGHAIWAAMTTGALGIALMYRHNKKIAIPVALSGFTIAVIDHIAINGSQFGGIFAWSKTIFETLAANGYLALGFFALALVGCVTVDLLALWKSLPKAREFNIPMRKGHKESLDALWDCILDLRRLNYAHFRYERFADGELPADLALTVAVLAKRLVNRYLAVEPVSVTVKGTINQAGLKLNLPDSGSAITVIPENLTNADKTRVINASQDKGGQKLNPFDNRPLQDFIDLPERYEIISQLGEGGMGVIFKARHKLTNAQLAIKVLHPHLARNQSYLHRFEQEARAASTLKHPSIVTVHDFGITENHIAYLVMEWLDGPSLESVIKNTGALPTARVIPLFIQTADALAHAHRKGVVHRDIKPSNIILTMDDNKQDLVKIVDFGIAKMVGEETEGAMALTRTGDVLGSPLFMSPEQCMGAKLDSRTDIYSLGCVMYEALCGVSPFIGENSVQVIFKHVNEMPKQPSTVNQHIDRPQSLESILFRCLQKEPDKRFASMDDLVVELRKQAEAFGF